MNRRNILKTIGSGIAAMGVIPLMGSQKQEVFKSNKLKGNINHSVCKWCFNDMSLEELAKEAKKIGLVGIDLIGTEGWDVLNLFDKFY